MLSALTVLLSIVCFGCGSSGTSDLQPSAANPEGAIAVAAASGGTSNSGGSGAPTSGGSSLPTGTGAGIPTGPTARVIEAGPLNYLALLRGLRPGDTLRLQPGTYDVAGDVPGLPIFNLNGTANEPIVITGPESGPRPVLLGRATHNTIRLANSSYVVIRNLEVDGRDLGGFGVATQGPTHHVTLENLVIRGVGGDQQIVGISTTGYPTWNWTIRGNAIVGAGTGMYLGDSDGSDPFVAGLIEYNVIRDTIGYNAQIKHQLERPAVAGMPVARSATVIRHNVFSKSANSSTGSLARPNLLLGHQPPSGAGANDYYLVYGNFFYQNPSEALFQAEGNVAFYSNVMLNEGGSAVRIQPHYDVPKTISIVGNTIVAQGTGVSVTGGASGFVQRVVANAVFAGIPLTGGTQSDNVVGSLASAASALRAPFAPLGQLDLYPLGGALLGTAPNLSDLNELIELDRDFNGAPRNWSRRGAYSGEGLNPGWRLALDTKR